MHISLARLASFCQLGFISDPNLEEGQQTDILTMDFAKAFDKVDHNVLTQKLHPYGIRGEVNTWIKNWLKDRTLSVVFEGEKCELVSVDSGVPQGSVLSLALFMNYINDLTARLRSRVSYDMIAVTK